MLGQTTLSLLCAAISLIKSLLPDLEDILHLDSNSSKNIRDVENTPHLPETHWSFAYITFFPRIYLRGEKKGKREKKKKERERQ